MKIARIAVLSMLPFALLGCGSPNVTGTEVGEKTPSKPAPTGPAPVAASVARLTLIDADTDLPLAGFGPLTDGAVLDLARLPTRRPNLRADTSPATVARVRFALDGNLDYGVDTAAPYLLAGNDGADDLPWTPGAGEHTLTVTPYTGSGSTLVAGTPLTVRFQVRDAAPATVRHLEYVAVDRAVKVYDIDLGHRLIKTISMPNMYGLRGIAASAVTDKLYIPYWGDRRDSRYAGQPTFGYLTCLDLKTDKIVWTRRYSPSIDSLSITPDGKKLYMGSGEDQGGDFWFVLDGATGSEIARISAYKNAHNTIVGASGKRVYMGSISSNELYVADTATDQVTLKVGPFSSSTANSGIRPFTVNGAETLAFVNVDHFSGFEVGDLRSGKRLYSVPVQGFPWTDPKWPETQSHGVALTPDEKEAWVLDSSNRFVHVFDISGLPTKAPRQIADIDVSDPGDKNNLPKWINFSRDGRFAHLSTGAIIDVATRKTVALLDKTRYFLQIDFAGNEPVEAYSRYGVGYGSGTAQPGGEVQEK